MNPDSRSNHITNYVILSLSGKLRNSGLLLGAPGNEILAKEHNISDNGMIRVLVTILIYI